MHAVRIMATASHCKTNQVTIFTVHIIIWINYWTDAQRHIIILDNVLK